MSTLVLFLAAFSVSTCAVDGLHHDSTNAGWRQIRLGMTPEEIRTSTGKRLVLREEESSSVAHADLDWHGQHVVLSFMPENERVALVGLTLIRGEHDPGECWTREKLVGAVKRRFGDAVYTPSRHAPELAEHENAYPMYALTRPRELVVLLKPRLGTVFFGREQVLD